LKADGNGVKDQFQAVNAEDARNKSVRHQEQNIMPGSMYDMIIQDKIGRDNFARIMTGLLLAIVSVALAVVCLGAADPCIVASGAAAAGLGIGSYGVYETYRDYALDNELANAGLADDPSVVWLVIAIAGVALDMGAAARAIKALGPAARTFNATSDVAEFERVVRTMRSAGTIDARIAAAAERAAAARVGFQESSESLGRLMSGRGLQPFLDPEVYQTKKPEQCNCRF
jgi:hypothetical protein